MCLCICAEKKILTKVNHRMNIFSTFVLGNTAYTLIGALF